MEFVKDLYDEGMVNPIEIAIECDGIFNNNCTGDDCVLMVNKLLYSLRKSGSIDKKKETICNSCNDFDCENCEGCDCECCK